MKTIKAKKRKNRDREPTEQIAVRLPASVVQRLQAHATRLGRRSPGLLVTRADAIRALLSTALDEAERTTPHAAGT